jgi:rare lipoprotein A (peptidoglycan hydrolase)
MMFLCLFALVLLNACAARTPTTASSSGQCYCECDPSKGSYSYYTAINKAPTYNGSAATPTRSSHNGAMVPPVVSSRYPSSGTGTVSQAVPTKTGGNYSSHDYRKTRLDAQKSAQRRAKAKVTKKTTVSKAKAKKHKAVKHTVTKLKEAKKQQSSTTTKKKASGKADKAYKVLGKWYYPLATAKGYNQTGSASWYGKRFHGGPTASGEKFDMNALTAAHTTLPFDSKVKVTNLATGANVVLRINDRGPFTEGRLIDVSAAAAERLGFNGKGEIKVRVEGLE